ncbi:hypothetical protein F5B20DRAFT_578605 [Whalleya microplaca]|nr:hypothetical protein F5B20DRAFT_578605 [Whalleya microplaca]
MFPRDNMPPSSRRQQPQDIRRWESSPKVDAVSTLLERDDSSVRSIDGQSLVDDKESGAQLAAEKKRDQYNGGNRGPGGEFGGGIDKHTNLNYYEESPSDDEEFPPFEAPPPPTTAVNGPTLTPVPPSRVTNSLEKASEPTPPPTNGPDIIPIMLSSATSKSSKLVVTTTAPYANDATAIPPPIETPFWPPPPEDWPSPSPTTVFMTPQTTPEAVETLGNGNRKEDDPDDDDSDGHRGKFRDNGSNRGLDETAEHLLIAAGAFILFCFVSWVVYRTVKKPKGPRGGNVGFMDKFPWRRKEPMPMEGSWDGRTLYMSNEPPPYYDKDKLAAASYYGPGKAYSTRSGSVARSIGGGSEGGTLRPIPNNDAPLASILDEYRPTNESDVNLTMRSRMPDPYYNQSELARQPSDAYDPAQRKPNRASQLSSISSGFGDGDIIVPQGLAVNKPPPAPTTNNALARFSWMTRGTERRETMYTTTSEDRPARFRTVGSWVNQQAGRVKRAGSRARERGEVPVIPAIPGEISATQQTSYR